ncbi:MAG: helix-turn-helix transcriptional regulator [Bacteroidales bacterium]|jgi:transcriptional regulator with XRE-family HTH domain
MNLGSRIKQLRLKRKLSLRELGRLAHISHSFIADIESGRSNPSLSTLEDLANALGTTTSYLLEEQPRTDNRNTPEQKIKNTISEDPELSHFWQELSQREDLKILFKQTRDMSPEAIKRIIRYIKIVEDEEASEEL